MPLDDRRLAMLREMGVPFWQPLARTDAVEPAEPQQLPVAPSPEPSRALPPEALLAAAPPAPRVAPAPPPGLSAPSAPSAPATALSSPAADLSTLDWPALREAVAGCRACGLCEKRRQTVFGVGHPRAHWMVVGEAPGEQEDLRGEPFVGPAGRLLDQMLAALGLTRAEAAAEGAPQLTSERQVYIANTLKCRPPGNRNPEPAELAKCEPFLVRQIELVQPQVILAMGRFAVQALLRTDEPIGRLRGRVHRYQGVPLIVTYHPAYLLRNLLDKAKAWDDLCLAMQTMEGLRQGEPV
jgi:uracil-DNA glycosylase